ncbi:MAG: hypothetical protein ICV74_07360 [Thermoleophilia bacterium]|nr:hypothetical protein [Thermoleophilia bacterium]
MLWFVLWFMVILKIPILYLAWVIWWAVKDPPEADTGAAGEELGENGGPGWRPHRPRPRLGRRRGPHGIPVRGARATTLARARGER